MKIPDSETTFRCERCGLTSRTTITKRSEGIGWWVDFDNYESFTGIWWPCTSYLAFTGMGVWFQIRRLLKLIMASHKDCDARRLD